MQEKIKELKALDLVQDCWWGEDENLFDALKKVFGENGYASVKSDLDIDAHRWYETSLVVFNTPVGFLGVRVCSKLYSEESSWSDIAWGYGFVEMEEVQVTSYKKK